MISLISLLILVTCLVSPFETFDPEIQRQKPFERIIGGHEAAPNALPYQVGIILTTKGATHFCGGSLISHHYVLTAAHCMDDVLKADIILGVHDYTKVEPYQKRLTSKHFTVHSGWDSKLLVNDIALIKLPVHVEYNEFVQKIDLAYTGNYAGLLARVSGWGKTSDVSSLATTLREVYIYVMPNKLCALFYPQVIRRTNICTPGYMIRGTCNGDSGGPLVYGNVQIGIVSFGHEKCEAQYPSVYTRVSEYYSWIVENSDIKSQFN